MTEVLQRCVQGWSEGGSNPLISVFLYAVLNWKEFKKNKIEYYLSILFESIFDCEQTKVKLLFSFFSLLNI